MEKLPPALPPKELPFSVKIIGLITGQEYSGNFVVKPPMVNDMSKIGKELALLGGGINFENLPAETAILHNAVAYLKVLLIQAPKWFTEELDWGLNSYDANVVIEVFEAAKLQVDGWYEKLNGEK